MKNILKSIFISTFPLFALYILIDSFIYFGNNGFSFRYLGRLLTASVVVFFFIWLFIKPPARTDAHLKKHTIFIFIGFLIHIISEGFIHQNLMGSIPSLMLFIGWIAYIKWYSIFEKRDDNAILKIGNQLPELELEDIDMNKVYTSSFIGQPAIFLFYRGNWCPLCMAQIKEIAGQYKELEQRGVHIVLISPQPHAHSKSLAKKFNLNFKFLVDKGNIAAKKLHILAKNSLPLGFQIFGYDSDTVMPTVLITDQKGTLIFSDLTDNYRVRPEPETFIKILNNYQFV